METNGLGFTRMVETGLSGEKNIVTREDGFDITVASEIMAILCLTTDIEDLKRRIGNITIGYNKEEKPITVLMITGHLQQAL